MRESSVSLEAINTVESLHNFIVIMKYQTIMFNDNFFHWRNLLQYFKKPYKPISVRKKSLFCTVTSTNDMRQIPKNQISVTESSITNYKTFIRLHIDYDDVIYHLAFNESFHQRLESIQAITEVIRGTVGEAFSRIRVGNLENKTPA